MRALLVLLLSGCAAAGSTNTDTSTYVTAAVTLTCERVAGRVQCSVSTSAEVTRAVVP